MDLVEDNKVVSLFGGALTEDHLPDDEYSDARVEIDNVLEGAKGVGLVDIILIGRRADDSFYFASTTPSGAQIIFDLESAKHIIMTSTFTRLE